MVISCFDITFDSMNFKALIMHIIFVLCPIYEIFYGMLIWSKVRILANFSK